MHFSLSSSGCILFLANFDWFMAVLQCIPCDWPDKQTNKQKTTTATTKSTNFNLYRILYKHNYNTCMKVVRLCSLVNCETYLWKSRFWYLVFGTRPFLFSFLTASLRCFGWIGPFSLHCSMVSQAEVQQKQHSKMWRTSFTSHSKTHPQPKQHKPAVYHWIKGIQ